MRQRCASLLCRMAVVAATAAVAKPAAAALPIDLEVAVVQAAPLGAMQEWGRLLSEMDLAGVRLRGAHAGDKPTIAPVGTGPAQRFRVLGVLNQRDQLILPGGAFGQGDVAKLKAFFEGLPLQVAEQGVERGIFGLTKPQFEQLYSDFSIPVADSTKSILPQIAVAAMTRELSIPLEMSAEARAALAHAKPLDLDLKGVSTGTALALALRSAGLALVPEQPPGKPFIVRVVPIEPRQFSWPVGWKPEKGPMQMAPGMYRSTTIEITGYKLGKALEAFAPHMGIPLIVDHYAVNQMERDFREADVKFPNRKTHVRRAVDSILAQGRVSGELRVDEANQPFYWITKFGPTSPRALGSDPAVQTDVPAPNNRR
jgi:hypothetical protein